MTITAEIREQVRQRANFACEFCGVTETDAGAELTIDHFRPITKGGDDGLENLLYCCHRCNQYKLDYWSTHPDEPSLWNARFASLGLKEEDFLTPDQIIQLGYPPNRIDLLTTLEGVAFEN